jgi:hypothetical protein
MLLASLKTLKHIIAIEKENLLYKRAIFDLYQMFKQKNRIITMEYEIDNPLLHLLFRKMMDEFDDKKDESIKVKMN